MADNEGAFEGAVMALLHPQFDLYGIDAKNAAMDQIDDITTLAKRHLVPSTRPVRPSEVIAAVREGRTNAERVGMNAETTDEWIAITVQSRFNLTHLTPEERLLRAIFGDDHEEADDA